MIVVFTHILQMQYDYAAAIISMSNSWTICLYPFGFFISGISAVCFFFILSGFVLSYRFLGNSDKWKIIEAIIKRPARLLGVVIFAGFTAYLLSGNLFCKLDIVLEKLFNNPFIFGIEINGQIWTIQTELYGSFLTFGIVLFFGNINKYIRLSLYILCFLLLIDSYYCAFVFGILMADIAKNWSNEIFIKYKNTASWVILIPAALTFANPCNKTFDDFIFSNISIINSGYSMIGAMLMFIFVLSNNKIRYFLEYKPLVFIGEISYSIYAIHSIIIMFAMSYIYSSIYMQFIIGVPLIIAISFVIDKSIDKPCINFSQWFAKKFVKEIQDRIVMARAIAASALRNIKRIRKITVSEVTDIEP